MLQWPFTKIHNIGGLINSYNTICRTRSQHQSQMTRSKFYVRYRCSWINQRSTFYPVVTIIVAPNSFATSSKCLFLCTRPFFLICRRALRWTTSNLFPDCSCSIKRTCCDDLSKLRMSPCNSPYRPKVRLPWCRTCPCVVNLISIPNLGCSEKYINFYTNILIWVISYYIE